MIEVYPMEQILKIAKGVLSVNDRIPPQFFAGPNVGLIKSVGLYRQLLRWRDEGVKYVKLTYDSDVKVGFNEPYSDYYLWSNRFYNGKLEPLQFA